MPFPELLFPSTQEWPSRGWGSCGGSLAKVLVAHAFHPCLPEPGGSKRGLSLLSTPAATLSPVITAFLPHATFQSTFGLFSFSQPVNGAVALCKPWLRRGQDSLQAHTWLVTPVVNSCPSALALCRQCPTAPHPDNLQSSKHCARPADTKNDVRPCFSHEAVNGQDHCRPHQEGTGEVLQQKTKYLHGRGCGSQMDS